MSVQNAPATKRWERVCVALWQRDVMWWPFVFLRPQPEREASHLLVIGLSVAGTALACAAAAMAIVAMHLPMLPSRFIVAVVLCFLLVLALLALTFALPWNRRARRLQQR